MSNQPIVASIFPPHDSEWTTSNAYIVLANQQGLARTGNVFSESYRKGGSRRVLVLVLERSWIHAILESMSRCQGIAQPGLWLVLLRCLVTSSVCMRPCPSRQDTAWRSLTTSNANLCTCHFRNNRGALHRAIRGPHAEIGHQLYTKLYPSRPAHHRTNPLSTLDMSPPPFDHVAVSLEMHITPLLYGASHSTCTHAHKQWW